MGQKTEQEDQQKRMRQSRETGNGTKDTALKQTKENETI